MKTAGPEIMTAFGDSQATTAKYKDAFFRYLFSVKEYTLSLLNALTGSSYGSSTEVKYAPSDPLMARFNDLAMLIDHLIFFMCEQQSTPNPNMPLRFLPYLTNDFYSQHMSGKNMYGTKLIKIPTPKFYVLYNGEKPLPDGKIRLSDAFLVREAGEPALELVAEIRNIGYNSGSKILKTSEPLMAYAFLVDKINQGIANGMRRDEAIGRALELCVRERLLASFLGKYKEEVFDVLNHTYDAELDRKVIKEEGREEGIEEAFLVTKMAMKGYSAEMIAKESGLTIERVRHVIKTFQSLR